MEFVEDSDKVKKGYAYVEMPTILLVTIPEASFQYFHFCSNMDVVHKLSVCETYTTLCMFIFKFLQPYLNG